MRGSQRPKETILYYQVKSKDLEYPIFKCNSKDKNQQFLQDETNLTGHITALDFKTFEYGPQSKKGYVIEFNLFDPQAKETYQISVSWSHLGRSFLNQLLNSPLPFEEPMELSLYQKGDYAAISLTYNRQWPGVRFKWNEDIAPLITEYKDPNSDTGISKSYKQVNEMLKQEVIKTILPSIRENAARLTEIYGSESDSAHTKQEAKEATSVPEKEPYRVPDPDDGTDDLPF